VERRKPQKMKIRVSGCDFEKKGYVQEVVSLRKLQNVNFLCSPNIIMITKFMTLRWADHVARIGDRRNAYSFDGKT
jgi:hypothetical protein